jgi:hypothetical protein
MRGTVVNPRAGQPQGAPQREDRAMRVILLVLPAADGSRVREKLQDAAAKG